MPRFFHPDATEESDEVLLTGAEAAHAARVLRVRVGETVEILNGRGLKLTGVVEAVDRSAVRVAVSSRHQQPPPAVQVVLVQALLKGKHFDLVLQKATELGVNEIVPVLTDRVIARPKPVEFADRREKWRTTVLEATKQCGAAWCPEVRKPVMFAEAIRPSTGQAPQLVASLRPDAEPAAAVLNGIFQTKSGRPEQVAFWIGPEGDFTAAEYEALVGCGARGLSFGDLVLRSETAALYALSILNYERGRASGVEPAP